MGGFDDAARQLLLEDLRCPKCKTFNRPGVHLVTLETTSGKTVLVCSVCGHDELYEISRA